MTFLIGVRISIKEEYIKSIQSCTNADGVVLSFDDSFIDHYVCTAKELEIRGLWGIFYIPTGAIMRADKLLGVHRVHFLNGKYGSSKILEESLSLVQEFMLQKDKIDEFDREIYRFSNYEENSKNSGDF